MPEQEQDESGDGHDSDQRFGRYTQYVYMSDQDWDRAKKLLTFGQWWDAVETRSMFRPQYLREQKARRSEYDPRASDRTRQRDRP